MTGFNTTVVLNDIDVSASILPTWSNANELDFCQIFDNETGDDLTNKLDQDEYDRVKELCYDEGL